ncbi:unnamed protein product [Dovyalis caffra]|uniref:Uncharacterized protein n=1 Tax=Dovyalis caffra TaxID=77055 RepID=A0AAV1RBL0_9ROSI|nr:unnamed protein product [Dovyalis caffra]
MDSPHRSKRVFVFPIIWTPKKNGKVDISYPKLSTRHITTTASTQTGKSPHHTYFRSGGSKILHKWSHMTRTYRQQGATASQLQTQALGRGRCSDLQQCSS